MSCLPDAYLDQPDHCDFNTMQRVRSKEVRNLASEKMRVTITRVVILMKMRLAMMMILIVI